MSIDTSKLQIPKPHRIIDRKYTLQVLRSTSRCLIQHSPKRTDCAGPLAICHLKTRGAGGSDHQIVIMCFKHHMEQGSMPIQEFGKKYAVCLYKEALENLLRHKLKEL